jgi:excisionase family DNA binding protein
MDTKLNYLTTEELARHLRVRASTIRRWAHAGHIPVTRLSSRVLRFDIASVITALRCDHERARAVRSDMENSDGR